MSRTSGSCATAAPSRASGSRTTRGFAYTACSTRPFGDLRLVSRRIEIVGWASSRRSRCMSSASERVRARQRRRWGLGVDRRPDRAGLGVRCLHAGARHVVRSVARGFGPSRLTAEVFTLDPRRRAAVSCTRRMGYRIGSSSSGASRSGSRRAGLPSRGDPELRADAGDTRGDLLRPWPTARVCVAHSGWDCLPPSIPARRRYTGREFVLWKGRWWGDLLAAAKRGPNGAAPASQEPQGGVR